MTASASKITFQPWVGQNYRAGFNNHRVMILGESHYHDCKNDPACRDAADDERFERHSELTKTVVDDWRDSPHRSPLSYRIPNLFGSANKNEFWQSVVFYNYLQVFAGPSARVRPSEEMWADQQNAQAFQEVLDSVEPGRILVLGKKLWANLPSQVPPLFAKPEVEPELPISGDVRNYAEVDRFCYWYRARSGKPALSMPIMHPAAIRFSQDEWIEPVAKWLSFSK